MPSILRSDHLLIAGLIFLAFFARPSHAFGAGNIASASKVEGQNFRHGDIEDTLLTLLMSRAAGGQKFTKLDVKRVYFGNWLRDYSQAVDVGTVKMVSGEAIRILLWILGFLSFGYGSREFEVTTDRLGCYRPEEHIDNPKDYADNIDARKYDPRLRGPIDERRELAINPDTGIKNYIASEHLGIATSAGLVRNVFKRSIELGRQYARNQNKPDLYEALRLLGTGCHCLEGKLPAGSTLHPSPADYVWTSDFSAHSNYTELAMIELGEREVFPHVGRDTSMNVPGTQNRVYPLVTGTFGGVDFLHSVMGEVNDKATQSEIQELEGTIQDAQNSQANNSMLQDLLDQLPDGLIGGGNQKEKMNKLQENSQAAHMENMEITPKQPEEWTKQLQEMTKQIYPVIEWHDEIMQSITETIEKIPVLPDLIENFQEAINVFVFSLIAPYVLPIIKQVKTELTTGSSEVIQSSRDKQLIVFHDDRSSDPTHSMLSKDHFSNVLNQPAGKVAVEVLKWAVPQLIACWDDEGIDVDRTLTRIINGVFHHPALREYGSDDAVDCRRLMYKAVEDWWEDKNEREREALRDQLSRDGVQHGRNHKEGVVDSGHGCGHPLGMPTYRTAASSGAVGGSARRQGRPGLGKEGRPSQNIQQIGSDVGKLAGEAAGGGVIGGLVGGIVGGVGASLLGDAYEGDKAQKKSYSREDRGEDGSHTQTFVETGRRQKRYDEDEERSGQAKYSHTSYDSGVQRDEYQRYEQPSHGRREEGSIYREVQETRPTSRGGYDRTTEIRHERPGGSWESEVRHEGRRGDGQAYSESSHYTSRDSERFGESGYSRREREPDSDDDRKKNRRHGQEGYGSSGYGESEHRRRGKDSDSDDDDDDDDEKKKKKKEKKYEKKMKKYEKKRHGKVDSDSDTGDDDDDDDDESRRRRRRGSGEQSGRYGGGNSGYGREQQTYGRGSGGGEYTEGRSERERGYERSEGYGDAAGYGRANDDDDNEGSSGRYGAYDRSGEGYSDGSRRGGGGGYEAAREGYGSRRDDDDDGHGRRSGGGYGERDGQGYGAGGQEEGYIGSRGDDNAGGEEYGEGEGRARRYGTRGGDDDYQGGGGYGGSGGYGY